MDSINAIKNEEARLKNLALGRFEPESCNVYELNAMVRILREEVYQNHLKIQELEKIVGTAGRT